jgi:hypothetical protein
MSQLAGLNDIFGLNIVVSRHFAPEIFCWQPPPLAVHLASGKPIRFSDL